MRSPAGVSGLVRVSRVQDIRLRTDRNAVPPLLAWHVANAARDAMGLPPVAVLDVLAWYAAPRPDWAGGAAWQRTAAAAAVAAGGAASADRRAIAP